MDSFPPYNQIDYPKSRLNSLLLILIVALFSSGAALIILRQINSYDREQIYLATQAALPEHKISAAATVKNGRAEVQDIDWKIYRNEEYSFEIKYPSNIQLSLTENKITLTHSVNFDNYGSCDMSPTEQLQKKLTDFEISFEIAGGQAKPGVVDGKLSSGNLNGEYEYYGAEGCGDTNYYFPLNADKTLIVRRANIQILSGIRNNAEEREIILKIPGAISREENQKLFEEILATFKFTK